eukprot:4103320-Amphidinium_carterae.1
MCTEIFPVSVTVTLPDQILGELIRVCGPQHKASCFESVFPNRVSESCSNCMGRAEQLTNKM